MLIHTYTNMLIHTNTNRKETMICLVRAVWKPKSIPGKVSDFEIIFS